MKNRDKTNSSAKRAFASRRGFMLVEVMIGLVISSALLMSFVAVILQSKKMVHSALGGYKATLYLTEMMEVAKDLEQSNWSIFETPACMYPLSCHPIVLGNQWGVAAGAETLDGAYSRFFSVLPVYRDQLAYPNTIVEGPGVTDPDTKKIVATLSWNSDTGPITKTLEVLVYRLP